MTFDVPSRDEIKGDMHDLWEEHERRKERTLKWVSVASPGPTPAATSAFIALPEAGYSWNLKLISVQLSASDTVQAFIASSAPGTGSTLVRLISNFGAAATSQITTFSSSQVYLRPTEGIYLLAASHNITATFVTAEEVMAEMSARSYD
jgi:hypothetical protein